MNIITSIVREKMKGIFGAPVGEWGIHRHIDLERVFRAQKCSYWAQIRMLILYFTCHLVKFTTVIVKPRTKSMSTDEFWILFNPPHESHYHIDTFFAKIDGVWWFWREIITPLFSAVQISDSLVISSSLIITSILRISASNWASVVCTSSCSIVKLSLNNWYDHGFKQEIW